MMAKHLNIALLGYGKMGREVEQLALQKGHTVGLIIDSIEQWDSHGDQLTGCDVAIEFTTPDTAPGNIIQCFKRGVPIVTGTTGWYHQLPSLEEACNQHNGTLFYSPNFSIGVNILFMLNSYLAKIMSEQAGYKLKLTEIHHTRKLDAPSGTALELAHQIMANNADIHDWVLGTKAEQAGTLPIEAIRMDDITGTHIVNYASDIDSIEIKHTANNRRGFTEGAMLAAEWVYQRKGVYTMKHILNQ